MTTISRFMDAQFKHFNACETVEAARAWNALLARGGKMFVSMAGAMSTAELGISLAEMIRSDKIHGICCTGANLEEDIFNLMANDQYERIASWRDLTPQQEKALEARGLNRVTDTCIPEEAAFRFIERNILELWQQAEARGERHFPHEYLYQMVREGRLDNCMSIDRKDSWLVAAAECDLPLFVPGWEDCTLGNVYVAYVIEGHLKSYAPIRPGLEYFQALMEWYSLVTMGCALSALDSAPGQAVPVDRAVCPLGFFQIGGGISGDFSICAVPTLIQDLDLGVPYWAYFCQISDAVTSYGGYSGAVPREKITWGKIDVDTPQFMINSDASIVAPLVFAYVLGL